MGARRRFLKARRPERSRGSMNRFRSILGTVAVVFCAALAGCGGSNQFGSQPQNNGNSTVVLAMTDTPPSNASILSAKVTLTLSLIHISEPTRQAEISYAVFC